MALGSLSACSDFGAEEVRDFGWVNTVEPVELKFVGGHDTTNQCVVKDGSKIKVADDIATIVHSDELMLGITGTSCPEGAKFIMTDEMYANLGRAKDAQTELKSNAKEANRLAHESGSPTSISGWFDTINEPYQTYRSITHGEYKSKMEFGDSCIVQNTTPVSVLGKLSTGDYAARVERKDGLGTPCPEGAIIIVPAEELDK